MKEKQIMYIQVYRVTGRLIYNLNSNCMWAIGLQKINTERFSITEKQRSIHSVYSFSKVVEFGPTCMSSKNVCVLW